MTREEALALLASGEFDGFNGAAESLEVEFKGEPYQLDLESQKFELAKDVTALANASGGVIVVGVRTQRDDQSAVDVVAEVRLLARGLVDEQQCDGTVTERVYPRLQELSVRFYPSAGDRERGLIAIDVPPQQEVDRYFLVQKPITDEGDRIPTWLVGIAIRTVGGVGVRRVREIHTLINRGLGVGQDLADVKEGVAELRELMAGGPAAPPETPADRLDAAIEARINEAGE